MKTKKSTRVNLDKKRNLFFLIGLTVTLSVTLMAFEWKTDNQNSMVFSANWDDLEMVLPPVTREYEAPQPKKKTVIVQFDLIDDKEEDIEITDLEWLDSEFTDEAISEIPLDDEAETETVDWVLIQDKPMFKGGMEALMVFLAKNIKYPEISKNNESEGVVYIEFVIGVDGAVRDAMIRRGIDPYIDKEALRVVNIIPNWTPGKQRGKAVNVSYILPIRFKLFP